MIESVRPAALSDVAPWGALQSMARLALVDHRGGPEWLADHPPLDNEDLLALVAAPDVRLCMAELDGVGVGHALTVLRGARAEVSWLFVEADARQLGLGEMLLSDAIEWARGRGALVIESVALPGDRETKNMFERFGMKARLLVVSRPLVSPDDSISAVDAGLPAARSTGPGPEFVPGAYGRADDHSGATSAP